MAALYETWHSIEELFERIVKTEGLTYLSFVVLEAICRTPENCTQKLICEQTRLPKQTVNSVIRSFWEQGYVEIKEIDADRRNKAITLSAAGQAYADKVMEKLTLVEEKAMGQLSFEQMQTLVEISKVIERGLRESL